jgi:hypothetical protein
MEILVYVQSRSLKAKAETLVQTKEEQGMLSVVKKVTVVAALMLFLAMIATPANNAEEVIFSKTGGLMTLSNGNVTPFGFWVWCAFHASPASTPVTYQSAQVCQGSMYFYSLGVPQHVVFAQAITEGANNSYTVPLVGLDPKTKTADFFCVLHNEGPISPGPTNTILANCSFSAALGGAGVTGTAVVTGAVVNDTGPR